VWTVEQPRDNRTVFLIVFCRNADSRRLNKDNSRRKFYAFIAQILHIISLQDAIAGSRKKDTLHRSDYVKKQIHFVRRPKQNVNLHNASTQKQALMHYLHKYFKNVLSDCPKTKMV